MKGETRGTGVDRDGNVFRLSLDEERVTSTYETPVRNLGWNRWINENDYSERDSRLYNRWL